jgi:CDP-glucose 4,6-dehydratase
MKILIFGNTGFKGFWLGFLLQSMGHKVVGVSIRDTRSKVPYLGPTCDKQLYLDIRLDKSVDDVIRKELPDVVINLAAIATIQECYASPISSTITNTIGQLNILTACKRHGIPLFLAVTSDKCYKNNEWEYGYRESDTLGGFDPYSASKAAAEILLRGSYEAGKTKVVTCRAGNVYGPVDSTSSRLVPQIMRAFKYQQELILRNPMSTRPWLFVTDAVFGYIEAMNWMLKNKVEYENFNFGPPKNENLTTYELASNILPTKYIKFQKIDTHEKEQGQLFLSTEKAQGILNWTPRISIIDGIKLLKLGYGASKVQAIRLSKEIEQIYL